MDFLESPLNFKAHQEFSGGVGVANSAQTLLGERNSTGETTDIKLQLAETIYTFTLWSHQLLQGAQGNGKIMHLRHPGQETSKLLKSCFLSVVPTENTHLPVWILVYSNADFQNYKTHILTWFDQQFYTAEPRLLSLSATHLYCWYAWLFYSVDHVWFNMPGYINSSETQMATQVLQKRLGCFAVVTHYIPLLIVTKSNRRSPSRGRDH